MFYGWNVWWIRVKNWCEYLSCLIADILGDEKKKKKVSKIEME